MRFLLVRAADCVTTTPLTGCELLSSAVAASDSPNAMLIAAFCGVPLLAQIAQTKFPCQAGDCSVFVTKGSEEDRYEGGLFIA